MDYLVVYSSKTGNTEKVAMAIFNALPGKSKDVQRVEELKGEADTYFVGFWNNRGTCSGEIVELLSGLSGKKVALFGTCGMGGSQEYFEERLYSFHSMREENRASYVLLKLEYYPQMTLEEADTALQASVRENDVWGISEKGELFLILSQTDRSSLPIILARLENDGFVCHEIDTVENANTGEKL